MRCVGRLLLLLSLLCASAVRGGGIWMDREDILRLSMDGPSFDAVQRAAAMPLRPNLSDQNDPSNVRLLARALLAARVFKGYLGDREAYAGFRFGEDLSWQVDPRRPVAINPAGAKKLGLFSVDGVLPDEQRRGGSFDWLPPRENYVYEGLQGALVQAVLLSRAGYDVWQWQDQALLRAYRWLHDEAGYPAQGDDTWQPHLINHYYGTAFPAPLPSRPGKNMGWTDWTHGSAATGGHR